MVGEGSSRWDESWGNLAVAQALGGPEFPFVPASTDWAEVRHKFGLSM